MPIAAEIFETGMSALRKVKVPEAYARQQISLLLEAELRGHASHGLLRLPRVVERIANGTANPATPGVATWTGSALLAVDGQQGLGPVVALSALDLLIDRVTQTGAAVGAIRNCNHLGMLAWYAEHVAQRGKILLALTISEALVHPWGGRRPLLGTNPISIGVPAEPTPFVFDMATSIISMGKIHDHANRNQAIPPGWALDEQGDPTTDAHAATKGAIAPFGGPKGYALGLAFEILVASVAASAIGPDVRGTLDSQHPSNKGDVFIVIEPSPQSLALVSDFLELVRQSPPIDPARPVRVPGDRAAGQRQQNLEREIELPPELWAQIVALAL